MANTFTADFPAIWAKEQQIVFYKTNVAVKIADISLNSSMGVGQTLNRPYRSTPYVPAYVRGTAITIQDLTDTQETLTVNSQYATGFYIDKFDVIQSEYDLAANYGKDTGVYLSNQVDATVLGEASNATSTVDDGTIGGTSGLPITLTTSNVLSVFSNAKSKLAKLNVPLDNLFAVISPDFENILVQYGAGRDTNLGDTAQENGFFGNFYGFKLYRSNQLANTAVLSIATTPTDGDTVTLNGVVFTFKTTLGSTPGNVAIGGSADAARLNLTELINAPGTTDAGQVALSAQNQAIIANATATDSASANTMTVYYKGVGALTVSETLTDATDAWQTTTFTQHNLFGATGAPTLVMQSMPAVMPKEVPDKLGKNYLNSVLYGVKTFVDNAKMLVNVKIAGYTFGN